MENHRNTTHALAESITKAASKQTYYTIRIFVDRDLVDQAYLAYGYLRWVDDVLDTQKITQTEKIDFISHQKNLLYACYGGQSPTDVVREEQMLVELVSSDRDDHPGLYSYLMNMMAILEFDANRQGQLISQIELASYSQGLATAVTDAMHYFIGHDDPAPDHESRYLAVNAAHITHMLRDTLVDNDLGYFNIPSEYLKEHEISPHDVKHPAYRAWICQRVKLARSEFMEGRKSLSQIKNPRCRFVGNAYTARFEWMLRTIEKENFCLRSDYPERKGLTASFWMGWNTITSMLAAPRVRSKTTLPFSQIYTIKEQ